MQSFETYDGNFRMTCRPWTTVTSVTRYEYQLSTISTAPDPISGLPEVQSGKMNSQIIAEDVELGRPGRGGSCRRDSIMS